MKVHIQDGFALAAVDKITLNGFTEKHVIMADDVLGVVIRYKTNRKGEILHINGNLVKEELNGRVKITFKRGWSMNEVGDYLRETSEGIKILRPNTEFDK